jgi:hypothetical protein
MDENERLIYELNGIIAEMNEALPELLRHLAALFQPPEWPQAEMDFIYAHLATETGLPARCRERACRRAGACRGERPAEGSRACAGLWSGPNVQKLEAACLGLAVAHVFETQRRREMAGMVERQLPPQGKPAGKGASR